jgi:anhydro-N-acetylmuramic acid kinase
MNNYISLGTMSGTSMDGIDLSIINSDGENNTSVVDNFFFEYSSDFKFELINIRKEILQKNDLISKKLIINDLSRKITLLHVEAINKILKKNPLTKLDLIGYHGHTLIHKPEQGFTFQLGNPELMVQLLKTKVIFNFRDNDIKNKGQGAPLVTLYHAQILKHLNLINNGVIINIGGIANGSYFENSIIHSNDIGPGNCLLDQWIRINSKDLEFDREGKISEKGEVNSLMQEDFLNHYSYHDKKKSLDITDFNIAQFRGLKLEDGAATLVSVTANLIADFIKSIKEKKNKIILAGGGRKNKTLTKFLSKILNVNVEPIDRYQFAGDFIESQAFAYLAVRSFEKKFLSLPTTTGVIKPVTGGIVYSN